ncbi:hypothetical protein IWW55_003238 [Coemansia sp. RSA 2706]|nr:hypothetical protein IWW55_003238 [Coemansia sp. RSA 2706]KAJ2315251.1 hypothetical protein IWW52_004083 [Coemansia sp. RSA 2704]KAJ2325362.1 hypothetical protein IWW51_002828 [Coemansia sp. RSA 2702]KAJ2363136.1 hypothetical protein H4S01_004451 [Coemansia sp. RSA 2610]KAJ2727097.1 hypothetical protein H4R23_003977 [Coemansia sp. Cherry 401B]
MTKGNRLEFELDQPDIVLRGMADDSQSTVFSGRLVATLCEPIRVKGLKMVLEGRELLQWEYHNDGAISSFYRETTPLSHTWTFFTTADGKKVETWEAGRHEFPFSLVFPGSLPETIKIPYANVGYQLKATLRRTGIMHNISAQREVQVKRDLTMDGGFGAGAIDVKNRWREMMDFSITSDADTYTPGDSMRARFAFQPLVKHMHLTKIGVTLKEYVRCHAPSGHAEKTVSRVAAFAQVVPKAQTAITSFEREIGGNCLDQGVPSLSAVAFPAVPVAVHGKQPEPRPLGIDLTSALEEHIQLKIPTDQRRLQYDHISSYIEISHKLKFSIHFQDPEKKPHTLWISVPISIVPTILDSAHGLGPELPTYQNAALDQRVVVAAIEPNPPTYDTVMTESLSRATSPESSLPATPGYSASEAPTTSSTASVHSHDETEMLDISTMGTLVATAPAVLEPGSSNQNAISSPEQALMRISRTHLSVDASRPLVHPSAVRNFFRRPVVFPASAEVTPMATPMATPRASPATTPISSPLLKYSDDRVALPPSVHSAAASSSSQFAFRH